MVQAKLQSVEAELCATLQSSENKSKISSDSTGEGIESENVTKKLEEELLKRDALIEVSTVMVKKRQTKMHYFSHKVVAL